MEDVKGLMMKLTEKDSLSEAINSEEFVDLITELEDKSEVKTKVAKKVAKEMGWDGKVEKDKVPEQLKEILELIYLQGYTVGLNVGRILTVRVIKSLIRLALTKIDQKEGDLKLKVARIISYFFKEGRDVNEVERNIIRILKQQGFSYREIARVTGRSLDTIHRHLKESESEV